MSDESKTKKDLIKEFQSLRKKVNRLNKFTKHAEARFNEIQYMAHIGSWELDLVKNNLIWSEEIYRIFEIDPEKFGASYEAFLNAIHPDDREAVNYAYTNSVKSKTPYSIDHRLLFPDGRIKFVHEECQTFYDRDSNAIRSVGTVQDITERKRVEEALREGELRFRLLYERAPVPYQSLDSEGRILEINNAWLKQLGYKYEEVIGHPISEFLVPEHIKLLQERFPKFLADGEVHEAEFNFKCKNGNIITLEVEGRIGRDLRGNFQQTHCILFNITERKRAEETLRHLNRELHAISNCNQILLRATDEHALLNSICHIICEEAGYKLAWVGYAEHDEGKTVRPVAWAGFDSGYIANAKLSWSNDSERGQGPAGKVIRSGEIIYVQDFATDSLMTAWRESAIQHGFRSGIALPLKNEIANVFGVLLIYSAETNAITPNEIRMLEELAGDLAYGITTLRTRAQRLSQEQTISRLNRVYKVLSETNQLIVREKNRDRLLKEICRIAVEDGGLLMASIGFVDQKTHLVTPYAWFGNEDGYFSSTIISIDDIQEGQGPTGRSIRENRCVFSTDITTESIMMPWKESALKRGFRSSAAFPLREFNKPIGALTVYAKEPAFFNENELSLMSELAMDISYALENINTEEIRIRSEELMHQSEEKFSNAFRFSPVALSISSMDNMKYIDVNESFLQLTGYDTTEVIGHTRDELNLWVQREQLQDFMKILRENGTVKNFEFSFRCKNGELKYGLRSASIMTIGEERCILAQTYDITEKKNAEEERLFHLRFIEGLDKVTRTIQRTNDLNQMMNDVLETVLSIFDCDRIWLFYPCDPNALSFRVPMEITKPEYPGAKVLNVDIPMPPDMSQNLREALESADPLSYIAGTEKPVNKVSAEQFGVKSMMMVALRPKSGKPWAFGMHQCSTPRIWTEEEVKLFKEISNRISDGLSSMLFLRDLQESEERFRRLTENARDVIYRMSLPDGKYEYISPAAFSVFGYSPEEFYNTPTLFKQAIHPDWQKYFEEQWENLIKGEMPPTYEYQIIHKSGEVRWLNQRNILVHDNAGNPIAIEGIVTDITERKRAESVILESEKRFKELANLLPQTIFESDTNGIITFANETALKTFGYSPEDISKGIQILNMVSETDKKYAHENLRKLLKGLPSDKNEYEMLRKDGTTFPALTFNAPIIRNGKTIGLRGTIVDITQRKLTENELRKLSEAVAQSPASIVITNLNGNIEYVNKTFEKTTGYSFDEVINQNPRILKSGFLPKEEYIKLWSTITSGNTWHGEFQNKKKNGEVYWEDAFISPIKDKDGNTINYLAVKQDITEKRKMTEELIAAKDQAEQSDKLKSEFLAQMSHEIRSPMNVTINLASLIKEDLGDKINEQTATYFEGIELASRRLIRTVDLILNVSEMQVGTYSPTFEKIDLMNDILESLRKEFSAYANHKGLEYTIQSRISKSFIYCDIYSVNQIFCNLIDNAIKYTQKGKVEVTVEQDFKENVKVTVSDTGIGISKEFLNKIFQPFMQEDRGYSRRYEGTGLGLALVKKYCDLNEAIINVESEKGKGSKFIVTFLKK